MTEPSLPMTIDVVHDGSWTVLRVHGDLDMATAGQLTGASNDAGDDNGLALDLSRVRFIDSTGLRTLLDLRREREGLVLLHPSGVVQRLLQLTKTSSLFTVRDALDGADQAE